MKTGNVFLKTNTFALLLIAICHHYKYTTGQNFQLVNHWFHKLVSKSQLNSYGSGIAVDTLSKNIILLHRGVKRNLEASEIEIPEDTVYILEPITGKILKSWGRNLFVKPHGIELTPEGDIFITDVMLHQVFKFEHNHSKHLWNEKPILTLGKRFVSGEDEHHFCSPADVAVNHKNGDFFIADGYCNSRIIKFDKDGKFLQEFGAGSSYQWISPIPFNVTHSLAFAYSISKDPSEPILFVADRNNGRIQSFTPNGIFLYEIGHEIFTRDKVAMLFSIAHVKTNPLNINNTTETDYGKLYAINGHLPQGSPQLFEIAIGRNNYNILSSFFITNHESEIRNTSYSILQSPHDIAVTKDGKDIYIVEASWNLTLWKFTKTIMNSKGFISTNSLFNTFSISVFILFYL